MSAESRRARYRGMRAAVAVVPTFVGIFIGFGIAAQVAGVPTWAALLLSVVVFAAPAQFAIIDAAGVAQMIAAGILVNLRFFLMSLTLSQILRAPRARLLWWAHFVTASSYLLTFFAARRLPPAEVAGFYRGVILLSFPAAMIGTVLGLAFGMRLSPALTFGATLFLPIYFALLLAGDLKGRAEIAAALLGFTLTPFVEYAVPGWGTFLVAIGAGALITAVER